MKPIRTVLLSALTLALLVAVMAACSSSDKLTRAEGKAPYYTSVEDALAAAAEGQYIVVDFYTDW